MTNPLVSLFLQLPLGILIAAALLEFFVLWKNRREVEPAVLWLLFCATGVSLACALAHFLVTGKIGYAIWIAGAAGLAAMGFWFKRQARNRGVLRLKDRFTTPGSYSPVQMPGQSTFIMGFRAALAFAILIAIAGIYFGDIVVTEFIKPDPVAQAETGVENPPPATSGAPTVAANNAIAPPSAPTPAPTTPTPDPAAPTPTPAPNAVPTADPNAPAKNVAENPAATANPGTPTTPAPPAPAEGTPVATAPSAPSPTTTQPAPTPMPAPAPTPVVAPAEARPISRNSIFVSKIRPIIQNKCVSCHGPEKQKGDLRLDTPDWIRQGVRGKPVVLAGKPDKSGIFTLIIKPPGDEDRMPPKGDGVSKNDAEMIRQWILKGADMGDGVSTASGEAVSFSTDALAATLQTPDPALLDTLKKEGVVIKPASKDGKVLEMTFSYADYGPGAIKLDRLAPIAKNIYRLDLGRTKIVDDDLANVAAMVNLEQLQLGRTGIGDAGLAHLKGLTKLEFLNLYQTKVTDAGLGHLSGLPKLKKLYTWQSMVTQAGADGLKSKIAGLDVNTGGN